MHPDKKATPKLRRLGSVIPARLERATHSLEGCCSIQLSYGTERGCKYSKFSGFPPHGEGEVGNNAQHDYKDCVRLVA